MKNQMSDLNDAEFLQWIHDRLLFLYGEKENYDYMHRLRKIIAQTEAKEKG